MPAVKLDRRFATAADAASNPFPEILHTPAGLAIIELQGTIHAPVTEQEFDEQSREPLSSVNVGRLEFPLYEGNGKNVKEGPWMKKVYLYIGKHQRLTGEIKKLPKALLVLSKNTESQNRGEINGHTFDEQYQEQLSIDAIVRHKIIFSNRPEPVGT